MGKKDKFAGVFSEETEVLIDNLSKSGGPLKKVAKKVAKKTRATKRAEKPVQVQSNGQIISQELLRKVIEAEEFVKVQKEEIKRRVGDGVAVEPGDLTAYIQQIKEKKINWRKELMKVSGDGYCKDITKGTEPTIYARLRVEEKEKE